MKKIFICLMAIAFAATGCTREPAESTTGQTGTGSITVRLVQASSGTRADLLGTVLNTAAGLLQAESTIHTFTVYVFDQATGALEKKVTSTTPASPVTIAGLTTVAAKKIVVIANNSTNVTVPTFATGDYDEVNTTYMGVTQQQSSTLTGLADGLVMTGEVSSVTVTQGTSTNVTIPVSRVVAKINLGKITIDPGISAENLAKFSVDGVSVQRAISKTTIGPLSANIKPEGSPVYVGGLNGTISNQISGATVSSLAAMGTDFSVVNSAVGLLQPVLSGVGGLLGSITGGVLTGLTDGLANLTTGAGSVLYDVVNGLQIPLSNYFYVLPNNPDMFPSSTAFRSTLLTLAVTYDGTRYYYPIEVNSPDYMDVNGNTVTGDYIRRNTIYNVNITIKDLVGGTDPDTPSKPGDIAVTIVPQDWIGTIDQNVAW